MSSMPCCRPFGGDELFVGRSEELVFLHAQLDGVRGGAPRLILIEGAAAIGKTALVRRFLAGANELTLLQASGAEGESILAYGVLSQLISTARAAAPDAPTILPDTGAPGPERIKHLNPLTAGAAPLSLLGELQVTGPAALVMVVDDAHWADVASMQAFTFAVRRLGVNRVLGIVITRDASDTHLPEGLRRVLASHETQRLVLEGLVAADLCTLSGAFGLRALPSRAAARLRAHTRGNPLHARALFEQAPTDVLSDLQSPLPAPRSYSLLVLARLARCGDSDPRLIGAASVLGLSAPLRLTAQLAGITDPLPALDEALRAGLLCEKSGGLLAYELFDIKNCHASIQASVDLEEKTELPAGQFTRRPNNLLRGVNEPFAAAIYPAALAAWPTWPSPSILVSAERPSALSYLPSDSPESSSMTFRCACQNSPCSPTLAICRHHRPRGCEDGCTGPRLPRGNRRRQRSPVHPRTPPQPGQHQPPLRETRKENPCRNTKIA